MKKFKTTDLMINVVLIIGCIIYTLIKFGDSLFISYFIVGGWQVISMIVHIVKKWFTDKGGARYVYNWITLVSLITFPIGSFWILLFTAPFMAVYYTYQCYDEVYVKMQRPLAQLK